MRAVDALRSRGIRSGILAHTVNGEPIPAFLRAYLVAEISASRPVEEFNGRIEEIIPQYRRVIESEFAETGKPVVLAPCLHGDCFGAVAALSLSMPEKIRTVSWLHADNGYDLGVGTHFEPIVHGYAGVSKELADACRERIPLRNDDVTHIRHSVPVTAEHHPTPAAMTENNKAIRLVYTGRIEEHQKRVSALPWIASRLDHLGVDYEFRVVGDGPSMDKLRRDTHAMSGVDLVGAVDPGEVVEHLAWGDVWVLASRFEGQSVAMLEAMGAGCVPIVSRVHSGLGEAIVHGKTGLIVEAGQDQSGEQVGIAIGDTIGSCGQVDLESMKHAAVEHVRRFHNEEAHAQALEALIESVCAMSPRAWAGDRPVAFSSSSSMGSGSGSTPADAHQRLFRVLEDLSGKRIAIFGAGRHTIDLASTLAGSGAAIQCIIDDHPDRWSTKLLGWDICSIDDLDRYAVTDVVLSSWMHEDQLAARCAQHLDASIVVHRLYLDARSGSADECSSPSPASAR